MALALEFTGQPPFTYTVLIDGNAQPALTTNELSAVFNATTAGSYSLQNITDGNGCTVTGNGNAEVVLDTAPTVSEIMTTCDPTNTNFTLSFNISGGDSTSYELSFSDGTIINNAPSSFTTTPLANGSAYNITITDSNNCSPTVVSGAFSCDCTTEAGSMVTELLNLCEDDTAAFVFNQDAQLDPNDTLLFVLHDNIGTSLGTIFAENDSPLFGFQTGMNYGQTYYVSAVATDVTPGGTPDYSSPCLSVSVGTPVVFYASPTGTITGDTTICEGDTTLLTFNFSGVAPFDFTIEANGTANTVENVNSPYNLPVIPDMPTAFVLTDLSDSSPPGCSNVFSDSPTVDLKFPVSSNQTLEICQGDSLLLAGAFQTGPGTYVDTLVGSNSCDSLVFSTLVVNIPDTTLLSDANCDPAQTGTFTEVLTNTDGCDSVIITTVTLLPGDTVLVQMGSCDPAEVGTAEELFSNQFGCDSLVITTTTLLPSDTTFLDATSCDPDEVGTEEVLLTNQFGCDSLIVTITSLLPIDTTFLTQSSCDPADVGTEETLLSNQFGCDSLIVTTTTLLMSDTTMVSASNCDPAEVGTTQELFTNQNGCDSLVITTTTLLPSDTTLINTASCQPQDVGTVTEILTNQFGCDSVVITTTILAPLEVAANVTSSYGPFEVSCAGGDDGMAAVDILSSEFEPPFSYSWSTGASTAEVDNLPAGTHYVTVSNANGCTAVDSVTLTAPDELLINLNVSPISCFGETDGAVQVVAEGGTPPYVYALDGGAFQNNSTFTGLDDGNYTVAVQDVNGCVTNAAILINQPLELEVSLGEDIDIQTGSSAILAIETNIEPEDIDTIIWEPRFPTECPDCLEQVVTPLVTTAYSVMVQDINGCMAGDQVNVIVDQRQSVYLPNIFSPNGDETNDIFYIQGDDRVEQVDEFQIYNRWGEPVFEAYNFPINDEQFGWDGTFRGSLMNSGVFVYYVTLTFKNGTTTQFRGDVILMR